MAPSWPKVSLNEAGVSLMDCLHKTPPDAGEGYPYIAIPQMKSGHVDFRASPRLITYEDLVEWTKKAKPQKNDVVLSRRCNPGETAHVPGGVEFALGQNLVLLRANGSKVHPPFLRWLVRGPEWWEQVDKFINVGAVFDSLRCADVPKFELSLPSPSEQRAIAHILGTLDDKIELNRRTNGTLEAMARALFKSWFVDFDPVRAKAQCQTPPGVDPTTAALFPSEFQDSQLGEIPRGWRVAPLKEWVDALSGGTPSKKNDAYWGGDIPWISPKVMTTIHADRAEHYVTEAAIGNGTRLAPTGATLVMVRGMGLHQEVRVSQALRDVTFNQDVKALVATAIEPTLLLYALLDAQQVLLGRVESSGHGTGRLPSDVLLSYPLVMPALGAQEALARPFTDINRHIALLRAESQTLARTRDALLPRLLSGDLSVAQAEQAVEART